MSISLGRVVRLLSGGICSVLAPSNWKYGRSFGFLHIPAFRVFALQCPKNDYLKHLKSKDDILL